jgi:hypothetical protein
VKNCVQILVDKMVQYIKYIENTTQCSCYIFHPLSGKRNTGSSSFYTKTSIYFFDECDIIEHFKIKYLLQLKHM